MASNVSDRATSGGMASNVSDIANSGGMASGVSDKPSSVNPLEQFTILAKSTKGNSTVQLVKQVLEAHNIFVFGELFDIPSVQELSVGQHKPYFDLLSIFAYGTIEDYESEQTSLPELSEPMIKKLRLLTIVAHASKSKSIRYSELLQTLRLSNLGELEDLIIDAIYADLVKGKLDQARQMLEVEYVMGRDVRADIVPGLVRTMEEWSAACALTLDDIRAQISSANASREEANTRRLHKEQEVAGVKASLKTQQHEAEDAIAGAELFGEKERKKQRQKGLRGSGGKLSAFLHKS